MFKYIKLSFLICLLVLNACSLPDTALKQMYFENDSTVATTKTENNFWTQKVLTTAIGLFWFTAYGPLGLGYLQWQRNIDDPKEPDKLSDVLKEKPLIPGFFIQQH